MTFVSNPRVLPSLRWAKLKMIKYGTPNFYSPTIGFFKGNETIYLEYKNRIYGLSQKLLIFGASRRVHDYRK